ncbi:NYN domain-containing protein [Diaphorobacter sp. HDW4A]|uniref:NYN domain-containing protein n=1 Tax=Diaphorobacter sp. HDW4A TaxID=2714924 RepID=UPI00140938E3|nr:NYN domain-containing protein [Diaphorobacter sp. HDW4A]QIL83294.1 NYN domain-containing protein [Diaphorobacter sp. HDW4A]
MPSSIAERQLRIALLIDADNAPAEKIDEILTELSTLGEINVRRAYGNWTKSGLVSWQNRLLEFAILPMQQFDYSKHKNATDMAMTVDAMELLYNDKPDAFGIVSSDADFTPLVMHLRSKGAAVYGFGAQQTPKPFVNACSRFLYLESLVSEVDVIAATEAAAASPPQEKVVSTAAATAAAPSAPTEQRLRVPGPQLRQDSRLMTLLRFAVEASQDESGWAKVGAVGQQIGNKTSFDSRNYGYASLTKLLAATQAFELRDEGTPRVSVRDKRAARGNGAPAA